MTCLGTQNFHNYWAISSTSRIFKTVDLIPVTHLSNLIIFFFSYSRGWIEKFYRGTTLPAVHGSKKLEKKNKNDDDDDDDNDDDNDDDDLGL